MSSLPIDRHARKQVLLTRIAFERADLRSDLARVHEAVRLPNLLRGTVGGGIARSLLGIGAPARSPGSAAGGWLGLAWSLLKRYRLAAAVLGGAAPLLRGRRGWRRWARLGSLAAAGWFGWRAWQRRDAPPR